MRSRVVPLVAVLAFVLAACGGDVAGTTVAEEPATTMPCQGEHRGGDHGGDRDDGVRGRSPHLVRAPMPTRR